MAQGTKSHYARIAFVAAGGRRGVSAQRMEGLLQRSAGKLGIIGRPEILWCETVYEAVARLNGNGRGGSSVFCWVMVDGLRADEMGVFDILRRRGVEMGAWSERGQEQKLREAGRAGAVIYQELMRGGTRGEEDEEAALVEEARRSAESVEERTRARNTGEKEEPAEINVSDNGAEEETESKGEARREETNEGREEDRPGNGPMAGGSTQRKVEKPDISQEELDALLG